MDSNLPIRSWRPQHASGEPPNRATSIPCKQHSVQAAYLQVLRAFEPETVRRYITVINLRSHSLRVTTVAYIQSQSFKASERRPRDIALEQASECSSNDRTVNSMQERGLDCFFSLLEYPLTYNSGQASHRLPSIPESRTENFNAVSSHRIL
ncbi:hypothetical protein ABW21_db0205540 [Orbilia brochopaga]|nr:hypothetical protein ABW21_db0205540 [Drechslerella brochopaga]